MKRFVLICGVALVPMCAQAAWFCGEEDSEFALNRAARHMAGHYVDSDDITRGRAEPQNMTIICDSNNVCHSETRTSTPEAARDFWVGRVDDFEKTNQTLDDWASGLDDGCLRDAYHKWTEYYRRAIAKDRRAIEFMRSPEPMTPGS